MAKQKVNPDELTPEKFRAFVAEANRQRENAAEYVGMHGQVVRNGIDRFGLDRNALTVARRLQKLQEKGPSTLTAILKYADFLGLFDQVDAFDDVADELRGIVERINTRRPNDKPPAGKAVLDSLVN